MFGAVDSHSGLWRSQSTPTGWRVPRQRPLWQDLLQPGQDVIRGDGTGDARDSSLLLCLWNNEMGTMLPCFSYYLGCSYLRVAPGIGYLIILFQKWQDGQLHPWLISCRLQSLWVPVLPEELMSQPWLMRALLCGSRAPFSSEDLLWLVLFSFFFLSFFHLQPINGIGVVIFRYN